MIGLVDYDLQTSSSTSSLIPNLEIMKISTYYKIEENIFCRLVNLDEKELTNYEKIYFFSEQSKMPQIPSQFLNVSNIVYGGTAFTNHEYIPFDNEIIDFTIARPIIYKDFLKTKYAEGIRTKVIEGVLDNSYYRMYAGNNQLPIPPIQTGKRVFIYDTNFCHRNWQEIIDEIARRHPSCIVPIHPIICHNLKDYFWIRDNKKIKRDCEIILDINIPLDDVHYMLKKYKSRFLADITESSYIYITLGGDFNSSFQYFKDFIYKINLLYSFWSRNIPLKIIYKNPTIGHTDPLDELSKITAMWAAGPTKHNKTLEERFSKNISKTSKITCQNQQQLLLKFHPSAKDLFNQNYTKLRQGGFWRL